MSHPLYLAFIWHMHQPYYRDLLSGESSMPWVRLHGTKDYLDMVKLLDSFPTLHQTFNLVPSLLDQLEEYLEPSRRSDRFLELSRKPAAELTEAEQRLILAQFFMANTERMIKPHPRYHDLLAKRGGWPPSQESWLSLAKRLKTQDYLDLQVWFNVVWIDPWLRAEDPELAALERKGAQFSEAEKQMVLEKHTAILQRVLPAYRDAQQRGQIELTTSPYYHPITPLLCDLRIAHVALPEMRLPEPPFRHREDARWHLTRALERHEAVFGRRPAGMWPPEGGVSEELVRLAIEARIRWIATDEEILWRTLRTARSPSWLYRPHRLKREQGSLAVVFRDRELSDLIGFVYSRWSASMAIQDFLRRLAAIAERVHAAARPALVSIILDGENAWESYPHDGHEFLDGLYRALANDDRFRLVTVSEFLNQFPVDDSSLLPELFPGSWIDGNFATWVGHPEKNTAWTYLANVRKDLEAAASASPEAWRHFYIAEGSDWMWWFGDTHSSAQDEEFDRLFRLHLANVYRALKQDVPAWLHAPIATTSLPSMSEPSAVIHPVIDGVETSYFEWLYAGRIDLRKGAGAMQRSVPCLQTLYYGCDRTHDYFRLDLDPTRLAALTSWRIQLQIPDRDAQLTVQPSPEPHRIAAFLSLRANALSRPGGESGKPEQTEAGGVSHYELVCAYRHILEVAVPHTFLLRRAGDAYQMRLSLYEQTELIECYPTSGTFRVPIPPVDFESMSWSV